jgi:ParB/RepB/Spo0J family partition protein
MKIKKVKCEDIIIKERFRKDLGNLDKLMESIQSYGLLQPIGITKDNQLIFGYRRLRAWKKLGHDEIEARIVDTPSTLEGEYVENEFRKNFTISERVAIGKALEESFGERRGGNHGNQYKIAKTQKIADSRNELSGKETREIASGVAGFGSRENYRKAKVIIEKGTPELVDKVDTEKITINAAYKEITNTEKKLKHEREIQEAAKFYKESNARRVVNADFYPWCNENLENDSVDLILTDPPYPKEFLPLWDQLGEVAARVLKPDSYLVTYSGQLYLPEVINALQKHLSYCWIIVLHHTGQKQLVHARNAICTYKPILIFRKGKPGKFDRTIVDSISNDYREKDFHEWGQGESAVGYLMKTFSTPNDLVLDTFVGGGTTLSVAKALKRKCIGIEKDQRYMDIIKSRLLK